MLTALRGDRLKDWLNRVYLSDLPSLHTYANGNDRDRDAVTAGLTLPHNSGAVEGSVTPDTTHQRQMSGHASPCSANASHSHDRHGPSPESPKSCQIHRADKVTFQPGVHACSLVRWMRRHRAPPGGRVVR